MKKALFIFILLCPAIFPSRGQTTYQLYFDAKGKIMSDPPEKLSSDDRLEFTIADPTEAFATYQKKYTDKLKSAKNNIEKLKKDAQVFNTIKLLYGIADAEINEIETQINAAILNPFSVATPVAYIPQFKPSDSSYYNLSFTNLDTGSDKVLRANMTTGLISAKLAKNKTELDFLLKKTDPYKKKVYGWLAGTKTYYPSTPFDKSQIKKEVSAYLALYQNIDIFLKSASAFLNDGSGNRRIITVKDAKRLKSIADSANMYIDAINSFDNYAGRLAAYKDWVLRWIWYEAGTPSINPFAFSKSSAITNITDTSSLPGLRISIAARESLLANSKFIEAAKLTTLDTLIRETDSLKKVILSTISAYKKDSTLMATNDKMIKDFGQTATILNKGLLIVRPSGSTVNYWMRHHDAADNNNLMNKAGTDAYLETDRILVIEHNLLYTQDAEAHLKLESIANDESLFSENMRSLLTKLSAITKITLPVGANEYSEKDNLSQMVSNAINAMGRLAKTEARISLAQNYILAQSDPIVDIEETADETSGYHSKVISPAKKVAGPKKASYYISQTPVPKNGTSTASVDTFTYRVNKLYRIFPMAGLNYTTTQFNDITYDSAHHQNKNTSQTHAHFVVGMKVFLRKTDIRSSKFMFRKDENGKCLFASRTNISIAFDALSPRNNFYIGAGLDPWPGVSLNAGAVFNRYVYNQYTDGAIVKTQTLYRPGFYFGLSTDISLFNDLAKFLNISK